MVINKKSYSKLRKRSEKTLSGKNKQYNLMTSDLSNAKLDVPTSGIINKNVTPKKSNPFLRGLRG